MERKYGGLIWTNHALDRLSERGIKQGDAWATWKRPSRTEYDKTKSVWVFQRKFGQEMIEVVAKKNEKKEWIVLSVWSKHFRHDFTKKTGKENFLLRFIKFLLSLIKFLYRK